MNDVLLKNFDRCCAAIEKCQPLFPGVVEQINKSCFFEFPYAQLEVLPQTLDEFGLRLSECFFLPFPNTGVINDNTLVSFWDLDPKKKTIGVEQRRGFLAAMCCEGDGTTVVWGDVLRVNFTSRRPPTILDGPDAGTMTEFTTGVSISGVVEIDSDYPKGFTIFDGKDAFTTSPLGSKGEPIALNLQRKEQIMKLILKQVTNVVGMAYMDVAYFNTPNRFVIETSSVNAKVRKDAPKIVRAAHRSFYTLLTPGQIKKLMRIKGEHRDSEGRKIHYRRAHPRYLGSDVFTHMQGQTIFVKAVWNFDEERVIDNKRYRVMVDV